jgi:hypothetical protein
MGMEKSYILLSLLLYIHAIVSNAKVKYQSNYLLPDSDSFYPFINNDLFDPLIALWENYYLNKKSDHSFSNVFRSLQLAFSASKMPTDNFSTVYDYGTKIGLWISSIEILFHPGGNGKIGYKEIIKELNKSLLING